MNLGRKLISPGDVRRYTIDYSGWLDTNETLTSFAFGVSAGPAVIGPTAYVIAADGKSVAFYVSGALISTPTFNVTVVANTSLLQVKDDHVEFQVLAS